MVKKPKPVTRTRRVRRIVEVLESRCHVCDSWFESKRPSLYCSVRCKVRAHRARAR
jgi:hypothetical protein